MLQFNKLCLNESKENPKKGLKKNVEIWKNVEETTT
jgi:hypothetical protein